MLNKKKNIDKRFVCAVILCAVLFIFAGCASDGLRTYGSLGLESGWTRYEAENTQIASIYNSSRQNDNPPGSEAHPFYSGGKAAGGLNKAGNVNDVPPELDWDTTGEIAYVKFLVTAEQAGKYPMKIRYNGDDDKSILVKTNNGPHQIVRLPQRQGGQWDALFARIVTIELDQGENIVWVSGAVGPGWCNIDCIDIRNLPLE